MFTQKENEAAQQQERTFITLCTGYRQLLTENNLPLSVSLEELKTTLRNQLFAQLLAVDAGLQMRWDMLRSEQAQQKLVEDTINLTGYQVIDKLGSGIKELTRLWERMLLASGTTYVMPERAGLSLHGFCSAYNLDLVKWLDENTFDWAGNEHVLAYFQELGQHLSQVRKVIQRIGRTDATLNMVLHSLGTYYTPESQNGSIVSNEHLIYHDMLPKLRNAGLLAKFPNI